MRLQGTTKKMILFICLLAAAIAAAGGVYYRSFAALPFAIGVVLGAGLNVIKLVMLERMVTRAVDMEGKNASNYVQVQYILRLLLTGVILVVGAISRYVNLWGVVAGIFLLPISAFFAKKEPPQDRPM